MSWYKWTIVFYIQHSTVNNTLEQNVCNVQRVCFTRVYVFQCTHWEYYILLNILSQVVHVFYICYSTKYKSYWKNVDYYLNFADGILSQVALVLIYTIYIAKVIQNINFNVVN